MTVRSTPLRALLLGALLASALPARAEVDNCALLEPADLGALLGGTVTEAKNGSACAWSAAGSKKRLVASRMLATGPAAESAYAGARKHAGKDGRSRVVEETGMGDRAFSVLGETGVTLVAIKKGRLLQLQYWAGAPGTPRDAEALRPIARKALARL
jgi:hypothetical protein